MRPRLLPRHCFYLLLTVAALWSSSGCRHQAFDDPSSFDVVVLVLDACRADRLGTYGYDRPTTPTLDALAEDPNSVVYERHYVAGNWTKPATASLFTGQYVHQHGVTNPHSRVEDRVYKAEVLDQRFTTMAESFRDAGYATLGLVTSHHLSPVYGFEQGFEQYFDPETLKVGDAGRTRKLLKLARDLDRPYFAYLHQNACHYPFRQQDRDPDFMAEFGFDYDESARQAAGVDFTTSAIRDAIVDGEIELTVEDQRFVSLLYDAKLRQVDREVVAPLIDGLKKIGRWQRTLLIVTADHGEELYEHRGYAHGFAMWDEIIRVPLIVKFPALHQPAELPSRVAQLTNNVDLYPSLLELLDQPISPELVGRSIFEPATGGVVLSQGMTDRPAKGDTDWTLIRGRDKVIVERSGRTLLYDLGSDPGELKDLGGDQPERLAALLAMGERALADRSAQGQAPEVESELSSEAIEQLRSLGYID